MRQNLPLAWHLRSLKDVAEIITGTTPAKKFPEYYGGSVPFVGPSDLGSIEPILKSAKTLSESGIKQARLLPSESVLVCCIGATIGKVGFAGTALATNQQINALVCDESLLLPKYAFHYCRTLKQLIRHQGASTTLPLLPKSRFQKLTIPLPPIAEQKRIAGILDAADALRVKRRDAIASLNTLLQSTFLTLFGDPITNPMGWEMKPLSYGVEAFEGGKNLKPTEIERSDGVRVLKVSAVTSGEYSPLESKSFDEDREVVTEHLVRQGDLLISRANTAALVGAVSYVWNTSGLELLPDKLWRFIWKSPQKIEPLFMLHLARSAYFRRELINRATGTSGSMKNIGKTKMLGIPIPVPPGTGLLTGHIPKPFIGEEF